MAGSTIPRRGRRDLPPYPTAAEWDNYVRTVLWRYARLLWEQGALDHARALPALVAERDRLEALRCTDPRTFRYRYRQLHMAMTNVGELIVPCTDGSVLIQQAPVLEPAARAGYDAVVLGVLQSVGLLHEAAPYEGAWLHSLVAHLLLSGERLDTAEKLLALPEPLPVPYHGERWAGGLLRVVREPGIRSDREGAVAQRLERALHDPFAPRVPLPVTPTKKRRLRQELTVLAAQLRDQGNSVVQISMMSEFCTLAHKAGLTQSVDDILPERTVRKLIQEGRAARR